MGDAIAATRKFCSVLSRMAKGFSDASETIGSYRTRFVSSRRTVGCSARSLYSFIIKGRSSRRYVILSVYVLDILGGSCCGFISREYGFVCERNLDTVGMELYTPFIPKDLPTLKLFLQVAQQMFSNSSSLGEFSNVVSIAMLWFANLLACLRAVAAFLTSIFLYKVPSTLPVTSLARTYCVMAPGRITKTDGT